MVGCFGTVSFQRCQGWQRWTPSVDSVDTATLFDAVYFQVPRLSKLKSRCKNKCLGVQTIREKLHPPVLLSPSPADKLQILQHQQCNALLLCFIFPVHSSVVETRPCSCYCTVQRKNLSQKAVFLHDTRLSQTEAGMHRAGQHEETPKAFCAHQQSQSLLQGLQLPTDPTSSNPRRKGSLCCEGSAC